MHGLREPHRPRLDPRLYQIASLTALLAYGATALDFEVDLARVVAILGAVLSTQYLCTRLWKLPAFDPASALISGLSLCLLLRTSSPVLAIAAAILAIAGKFVLRWNGKHVFNPTNFALVAMMTLTGQVWVSPGQWGNLAFFAFLITCLGGVVVQRAARADVTSAFIAAWAGVLLGRALWLGQPLAIPLHQLGSGALLLFSFFMISDPRTTPDSRVGRVLFAVLVALGAGFVQFVLFRTNGLLWSLAAFSLLVPLLDRLFPGHRYQWRVPAPLPIPAKGSPHATLHPQPLAVRPAVARQRA